MVEFARLVRDVPDFPRPGILFRDVTPLLRDALAFRSAVDLMAAPFLDKGVDQVVAIESRGFLFGAPIALVLGAGFVPVRKAGKLPHLTYRSTYDLEYDSAEIEIHRDALAQHRVLLVDDVLATGGTLQAALDLIGKTGSTVVGISVFIELTGLKGRNRLDGCPVFPVIKY